MNSSYLYFTNVRNVWEFSCHTTVVMWWESWCVFFVHDHSTECTYGFWNSITWMCPFTFPRTLFLAKSLGSVSNCILKTLVTKSGKWWDLRPEGRLCTISHHFGLHVIVMKYDGLPKLHNCHSVTVFLNSEVTLKTRYPQPLSHRWGLIILNTPHPKTRMFSPVGLTV